MIGLVEVEVTLIKRAYQHLKNDDDTADEALAQNKNLVERINHMADIINTGSGKKEHFFKKKEKIKLKKMLREVAYASYATNSSTMFIRIEMASIILDIIKAYEDSVDTDS